MKIRIKNILRLERLLPILIIIPLFFLIPISNAYGVNFPTAMEINPSIQYNETMLMQDTTAYYKIELSFGQDVSVRVEDEPSFDLNVYIYDPNTMDLENDLGSEDVTIVNFSSTRNAYYYIMVYRFSGVGDTDFNLTVEVSGGGAVPGFELVLTVITILSVGLMVIAMRRSKYKNLFCIY